MLVVHTASPCDRSLIPYRDFMVFNTLIPLSTGSAIPDIPMHFLQTLAPPGYVLGPYDPFPCDNRHTLCRDSGFHDFRCHKPLPLQSPDYRSTDALLVR